ncbi:MAG: hypothetical protein HOP28_03985 [Gemmatimonadales bacterium]|nr:hypothetical protein [Gemmatimonadales bacterium]
MWPHPSFAALTRYVEKTASAGEQRRLAAHLAACPRCRATILRLRELPSLAQRAMRAEPDLTAVWQRVGARLDRGDEVLLPLASATAASSAGRRILLSAGMAAILGLMVFAALRPRALEAARSELRFGIPFVTPGEEVEVEYRATGAMTSLPRLILRARFRDSTRGFRLDGVRQVAAATLDRRGQGRYAGRFRFPAGAVIGAFAVEDTAGALVDANGGRLWYLAAGRNGAAAEAALEQRAYDEMAYDFGRAIGTLRDAAVRYPDNPWRWAILRASEPDTPPLVAEHRARFDSLHRALAGRNGLSGAAAEGMLLYAMLTMGSQPDSAGMATFQSWENRLIELYPTHPRSIEQRVFRLMRAAGKDRKRFLAGADSLWAEAGYSAHPRLLDVSLNAAIGAGDGAAIRVWAERWLAIRPWDRALVARRIAAQPTERSFGLEQLRQALRDLDSTSNARRELQTTRTEQARVDAREHQELLVALGMALFAGGDLSSARDTLRVAVRLGPWVSVLAKIEAPLRSTGERETALWVQALRATDLLAPASLRDSIWKAGREAAGDSAWRAVTAKAIADVAADAGSQVVSRHIDLSAARAQDSAATSIDLGEVAATGPTMVVFWHPWCPYSRSALTRLKRYEALLGERGIRMLFVTEALPLEVAAHDASGEAIVRGKRVFDPARSLNGAFSASGTPTFVLLKDGMVVFAPTHAVDDAVRNTLLLAGAR